ncbi:MAG: hypothetical protein U5J64_08250 [Halobacteriales archaeon]|nr:hypothetical protein [Halobacteriales archaeon]
MQGESFPQGIVLKVNPHNSNERELFGDPWVAEFIQVKFHRSTWFLNNQRSEFLTSEQKLIVNTMENDRYLLRSDRTPSKEFERFQELDGIADIAFPGDRLTYESMGKRELAKEVELSVVGQLETYQMVEDANLDLKLYPIIVGWEPWHYERQRVLFKEFGTRSCAFDGTQYNSINKLVADLEALVEILNPNRIYLNGRVSAKHLHKVPREVVAASGIHSLLEGARLPNGEHSRDRLVEIITRRTEAVRSWQTELSKYHTK